MNGVLLVALGLVLFSAGLAAADKRMCRFANETAGDD